MEIGTHKVKVSTLQMTSVFDVKVKVFQGVLCYFCCALFLKNCSVCGTWVTGSSLRALVSRVCGGQNGMNNENTYDHRPATQDRKEAAMNHEN